MTTFKPNGQIGKVVTATAPTEETKIFTPKPIKRRGELETEFETGPVKSWSFSSLQAYEQCPRKVAYKRIDKIAEPSGAAAQRGSEIHDLAERFVRGELGDDVPEQLSRFENGFQQLKAAFADGKVSCEEDWFIDKDWTSLNKEDKDYWGMQKLDAFLKEDDGSALIIDYKTGKKFGNELKHGEQGLTYAIAAFLRFPELDFIKIEFWYLDKGEKLVRHYTRQQALIFHQQLHERAVAMTTATDFPATPSVNACRFCYYGNEGICPSKFDASNL